MIKKVISNSREFPKQNFVELENETCDDTKSDNNCHWFHIHNFQERPINFKSFQPLSTISQWDRTKPTSEKGRPSNEKNDFNPLRQKCQNGRRVKAHRTLLGRFNLFEISYSFIK